jgi:hypothetical protein
MPLEIALGLDYGKLMWLRVESSNGKMDGSMVKKRRKIVTL